MLLLFETILPYSFKRCAYGWYSSFNFNHDQQYPSVTQIAGFMLQRSVK